MVRVPKGFVQSIPTNNYIHFHTSYNLKFPVTENTLEYLNKPSLSQLLPKSLRGDQDSSNCLIHLVTHFNHPSNISRLHHYTANKTGE